MNLVQFSTAQLGYAVYGFEKLPYTSLTAQVPTGESLVFSVNQIDSHTNHQKLAILSDLAVTQASGLRLAVAHQSDNQQFSTAAFPGGLAPLLTHPDAGFRSTQALGLSLQNNNAATLDNVQVNYAVAVRRMTVAEKLLRGVPLTHEESDLAAKYLQGGIGVHPHALSQTLERVFLGRVVDERLVSLTSDVSSTPTTVLSLSPASSEILIVRSVASNAPVGNLVTVSITADDREGYCQVLADNMSLEQPFSSWIVASNNLYVQLSSVTSTNSVPLQMSILRVRVSLLIQALLGLVNRLELSGRDLEVYDKVRAGAMV